MSAFERNKKRYLPTTLDLYNLREDVLKCEQLKPNEGNDSSEEENLCKLLRIRNEVGNLLSKGKRRILTAIPYFFEVWKIFSSFPVEHYCYLPPLYKSDTLVLILETAVKRLLQREVGMITGSANNAGHLVLGGVEGVGKTTLMRALALSSAALLKHMIPICHDYLVFKTPECILWEALDIYHSLEPDSEADPLDVLNGHCQNAFLLLDEFQHNFIFADNPAWIAGRDAAITFHRYSRTCGTFCVIGGSSVDMPSLLFKQGSGESTDHWRKRGYPDFNGTLYEPHTVPALRTVEVLEAYIHTRYPLWDLKKNDLSLLLAYTGGIGRWVHIVWEECMLRYPDTLKIPLCSEECIRIVMVYRKVKHEKVLESAENRVLIAYLLMAAQPEKDAFGNISHCGGVDKVMLRQALSAVGVGSPSDIIDTAEANSIIYIDANGSVQFSRPVDAIIFNSELPPPQHKLLLLSAVHLMVCGIFISGGGNVTDVNAGYALEELVREGVYTSANINEYAQYDRDVVLIINNDRKLCIQSADGLLEPLTLDSLRELNLKHIRWIKEHGLDGICFEEDESQNNSWYLDLWQCEGGRRNVEIGGGNNSMITALTNYKKNYQLKDVGDKHITEIVMKAQVGVCLIVQAIRRTIPGVIITPRRLIVTTTKQCNVFCVQTLKSWRNAGGVVIEKDILKHFRMTSRSRSDKALRSRFEVKVESGCNWVVNAILDPSLLTIANQLLLSSTTTTCVAAPPSVNRTQQASCSIQ